MAMARNAKTLIEENLRYPDGTPVQVVIADSTIGGGAEAAACADKFSRENVVATLNHGVTVYGHVGADLITLASMLRIPVALHNVPEEKTYRPHSWAAFGTKDAEAADFAACKHYGPLYA